MGLGIFRRDFVVRRFGESGFVDGYGVAAFTDTMTSLNVQPLSKDELRALPEGQRRTKRMKAFGDLVFTPSDEPTGRRGDWLYYRGSMDPEGHWYECVSSLGWDHTMLSHCRSDFVQVSESAAKSLPPPDPDLIGYGGGCCL